MTYYPLNQNEVFITRIETHPEYLISDTGSQYLTFRDRYNTQTSYHTYYYTTAENPLPFTTASISFFDSVSMSSSLGGAIKSLQEYHSSFNVGYDSLSSYTGSINVISIPKAFYGKELSNFCMIERVSFGYRIVFDDGYGQLFVTHSAAAPYSGSTKIGNIYYTEGVAFVYFSTSFDTPYHTWPYSLASSYEISFTGSNNIYTQNVFCHLGDHVANASNNESAYITASNGEKVKLYTGSEDRVFISALGLYDKENKLVASAKFSSPIRKYPNDKLLYKLHNDIL